MRRITAPFDRHVEPRPRASSTCLVVLDRNRGSVPAAFAGHAVSVCGTATEVRVVADGTVIADRAPLWAGSVDLRSLALPADIKT